MAIKGKWTQGGKIWTVTDTANPENNRVFTGENRETEAKEYIKNLRASAKHKPTEKQKRFKRLETQPEGYPGSLEARDDSAKVYKDLPEFTPGHILKEQKIKEVDKLLDDLISTEERGDEFDDSTATRLNQIKIDEIKKKIADIADSSGVTPIEPEPEKKEKEGWWAKKWREHKELNEKREVINKRKQELLEYYTNNRDKIPINPQTNKPFVNLNTLARNQAEREWEETKGDNLSTMSDEELIKRAGK